MKLNYNIYVEPAADRTKGVWYYYLNDEDDRTLSFGYAHEPQAALEAAQQAARDRAKFVSTEAPTGHSTFEVEVPDPVPQTAETAPEDPSPATFRGGTLAGAN